jgi:hypothetical protein
LRFRHQGIYRIEQGIFGPQETAIDIVTKLSQYVNVHLSKLPFWFDDWNFTQSGRPPQGWGPFVSFSLNAKLHCYILISLLIITQLSHFYKPMVLLIVLAHFVGEWVIREGWPNRDENDEKTDPSKQ